MSAVRLPPPPSTLPPLVVDPGQVEDCGLQLQAVCTRLDDLGTFVAGPARLDDWSGAAALAYEAAIDPLGRGAEAMSLALRRVGRRVLDHGGELSRLLRRHVDLVGASSALAGDIELLRRDIAAATPDRLLEVVPVLQARSDALAGRIATYEVERERWELDLAREEREMIAAFERLLTLEAVDRRFGGAPDPADEALATLPAPGASPGDVFDWWQGLTPAQRSGLVVAAPGVIGNLDGLPALARHRANLVRLERDLAGLRSLRDRGELTGDEAVLLRNAEAAAGAVRRVRRLADPRTGDPVPVRLYLYDPGAFGGDGAVAVAVGDPDRADDVSLLVPGMGTDGTDIDGLTRKATAVYEAARATDGVVTHASLAWIGYDAPDNIPLLDGLRGDVFGVVGEGMAERGGEHLADTVDGLRSGRIGPPADLSVIGHSYGSTTVGHAAHDHGLAVDDLVVVGSPGLGSDVEHATDLGIDPHHVWAGANSHDVVTEFAGHGSFNLDTFLGAGLGDDPAEDDFGATRFQAESTTRGLADDFGDHEKYFDHDTESLHNLAEIVTGHYDDVQRADPVTDPWYGPPTDPERGRTPTAPTTRCPR